MDASKTAPRTTRPQLLLVEDDPAVRRSMQLLLQAQGYVVRAYATGQALIDDEKAIEAHCFIADYRLEHMDGITVLSQLRERGWRGPAILVTAFPSTELSDRAREAGFSSIFDKPLRQYELVDTVSRLLADREAVE